MTFKGFTEIAEGLYFEDATSLPWSTRTQYDPYGADLHRVHATSNGKYYKVKIEHKDVLWHQLVYDFFIGGREKNNRRMVVDHIDGNTKNNFITNLQYVSQTVNAQKKTIMRSNKLGVQGVKKQGNSYRTRIVVDGKLICIGSYGTIAEAHLAYLNAKIKYHGVDSVSLLPTIKAINDIMKS